MKDIFGKVAIMGGGSWATALAKIVLSTQPNIHWYMRRPQAIEDFKRMKHNPGYLSAVSFDTDRIDFYSDINAAVKDSDILIFATPSPFADYRLSCTVLSGPAGKSCDHRRAVPCRRDRA